MTTTNYSSTITSSSGRRSEYSPPLNATTSAAYLAAYPSTSSTESTPLIQFEGKGYVDWQRKQSRRRRISSAFLVCGYALFVGLAVSILIVGAILPLLQRGGVGGGAALATNHKKAGTSSPSVLSSSKQQVAAASSLGSETLSNTATIFDYVPRCDDAPCFRPERIQVPTGREGFPSYWDYARPMNVRYVVVAQLHGLCWDLSFWIRRLWTLLSRLLLPFLLPSEQLRRKVLFSELRSRPILVR